ncbi:nuclease A inhibitor family protein [Anabaena sp. UHCC 0451]|uniref:nuclease A inhibitor family protein n=1 Tax=Anabaena sp. UHCC 0451 TaxID=2055235 RepID=UPI002B1F9C9C|nr:nuclease A inhibitor family protein [Anabaena sp. UHCC 0451]MEA5576720.1 nuclease A inhibitor family protein [Anabaena sp. UHCC 0451]
MKSKNAELLQQLTEVTTGLEFPWSDSSDPINPFLWEVATQGEFTIENLLRSETPNFDFYAEGGKFMRIINLDDYIEDIWQKTETHKTVIELLKNNTLFLEAAEIRLLHDPHLPDTFNIMLGLTKSGEWIGISPQIQGECREYNPTGEYTVGSSLLPVYQPQTAENIKLLTQLETLLKDLDFYEPNFYEGFTDKGYVVKLGKTRELMLNNLLDAIGFARTFPFRQFTPVSEYEDDFDEDYIQAYQALDNFLESKFSNLYMYLLGISCCYCIYVIGETEDGDFAGVTSMAAWS